MWYPVEKGELDKSLEDYLKIDTSLKLPKKIHGILVPHAGYMYSGAVAGMAFSLLQRYLKKNNINKAVIIGPSHYVYMKDAVTSKNKSWKTPLGTIKTFNSKFPADEIEREHSIDNQIPFLQKLGIKKILPLMIGEITKEQAEKIAKRISKINALYVFSSDLSHFLPYQHAVEKDKKTIEAIQGIDPGNLESIDACGLYPILVMMHLCRIKNTKPSLIVYKNSGDITGEGSSVVGYAAMWF